MRRTPRTALRDEYEITDSIQIFIDDGYRVEAADVIHRDLNVSYAEDLLELNLYALSKTGEANFIGENVTIHPDSTVEGCVIMDGARITTPITMRDSLVFAGVEVSGQRNFEKVILTEETEIQCDG